MRANCQIILVSCTFCMLIGVAAQTQGAYFSIADLWAGVDPRKDPLEVEIARDWTEDTFKLQRLYFTGEIFEDQKVRVYAIQGAPAEGKQLPGILHIHGGGQTASLDWVRFWAKRGYVCVSFDYCGDWRMNSPDRTEFTKYGKLPYDMAKSSGPGMKPDARHSPTFHWTLLARRALTLLESHPQIDPSRIGIFGISVGGSLTWLVAGTDHRVKAAVPIYGCGWNSYIRPDQTDSDPVDDDTRLSRKLISSESYAPLVRCSLLFLDASNDFHGNMDRSFATLAPVPISEKRQAYTPRYNHHLEPAEGKDLPLWMDHCLKGQGEDWPQTPKIELSGGKGGPRVDVYPDPRQKVSQVEIYYALSNPWPQSRFWRAPVVRQRTNGCYAAEAPYFASDDVIYAFANVTYASGIRLSSLLIKSAARDLPGAQPSLKWEPLVDDMRDFDDWRYGPAYTDPWMDKIYFSPWHGPQGDIGFTLNAAMWGDRNIDFNFGTHKIGDPQWRGRNRDILLLDYDATRPLRDLRIEVTEREWQPGGHKFTLTVDTPSTEVTTSQPVWRTISITPDGLKDQDGKALADWREVNVLTLLGVAQPGNPPLLRNLRWNR